MTGAQGKSLFTEGKLGAPLGCKMSTWDVPCPHSILFPLQHPQTVFSWPLPANRVPVSLSSCCSTVSAHVLGILDPPVHLG